MSDRKVDSKKERASICSGQFTICSVNDIDDAISVAKEAKESGIFAIELCGAFKEEGCKKIIEATDGEIPVEVRLAIVAAIAAYYEGEKSKCEFKVKRIKRL